MRQPTAFIPHGGGPCFFMDDPAGHWRGMEHFLRSFASLLPEKPRAIAVISGHWETTGFQLTSHPNPPLMYDYYGFPPHTYTLSYNAPGDPQLAQQAAQLLAAAQLPAGVDNARGLDHGVFIPLKVAFPAADIPVVELSVERGLDPSLHLAAGRALAPLREKGVLILGTGMSFHNMRGYGDPRFTAPSEAFDAWLRDAVTAAPEQRNLLLSQWQEAPYARQCHPQEEHLLPLMAAAGAATGIGRPVWGEQVLHTKISAFLFD